MSSLSPFATSGPAHYTSLGPTSTPGGFSGQSFGTPGLPNGFGFPSYGDPMFYFMPAASSFFINRLLGFANGSAVNINVGPTPSHLGMGDLLLGLPFYRDAGAPSFPGMDNPNGTAFTNPAAGWGTGTGPQANPVNTPFYQNTPSYQFSGSGNPMYYFGQNPDVGYGGQPGIQAGIQPGAGFNGSGFVTSPWGPGAGNVFDSINPPNAAAVPSAGTASNNNNALMGAILGALLGQSHGNSVLNPFIGGSYGPSPSTAGVNVTSGTGKVWGDPHFVDLEHKWVNGQQWTSNYDVMGEGGKTYVILSDQSIQLNGEFKEAHRNGQDVVTVMGKVGLKLMNDAGQEVRLVMDADGASPTLDGKVLSAGESYTYQLDGKDAVIEYKDNKLMVSTAEYNFTFNRSTWQYGNYLNYEAKVKDGVMADGVNPHGLLGQTADFDGIERIGKRGAGAQGEGAIDLNVTDYEVKDLFADSTHSVIDRYGTQTHGDNAIVVGDKVIYSTLKNDQGDLLMAVNRDGEGRIILNEQGEAAMVGVRRNEDAAGKTKLYLADGKTEINQDGQVIHPDGTVKAGNAETVKPTSAEPKKADPPPPEAPKP